MVEGYSRDGGLLCPTYEDDDCECDGKVTWLTLQYNGSTENNNIKVVQKKPYENIFQGNVSNGEQFTFSGTDKKGTMGTEISVFVGSDNDPDTKIHTSCSQPIYPGLVSGSFTVVDGASRNGGRLCPIE